MIPFNKPHFTNTEIKSIKIAKKNGQLSSDGKFTKLCNKFLEKEIKCKRAYLTHSCTAALETAAILIDVKKGDEIIMPSFTFVTTASSFVLRGGIPVFVDINKQTLNLDCNKIEKAITKNTKAIVAVHYAGISNEIIKIKKIAKKYKLILIEDAAHCFNSKYDGISLGSIGDIACMSFHETKNIISGEGGAILINNKKFIERAEIIIDKGTNRKKYLNNEIDKYSWVDVGSSFQPSEIIAAFLWSQFKNYKKIINKRKKVWDQYYKGFKGIEKKRLARRPIIPPKCMQSYHMFYLLLKNNKQRNLFIKKMKKNNIHCVFHYVPLHSSKAGKKYTKSSGSLINTNNVSKTLVRLPLWPDLSKFKISKIIKNTNKIINEINK